MLREAAKTPERYRELSAACAAMLGRGRGSLAELRAVAAVAAVAAAVAAAAPVVVASVPGVVAAPVSSVAALSVVAVADPRAAALAALAEYGAEELAGLEWIARDGRTVDTLDAVGADDINVLRAGHALSLHTPAMRTLLVLEQLRAGRAAMAAIELVDFPERFAEPAPADPAPAEPAPAEPAPEPA